MMGMSGLKIANIEKLYIFDMQLFVFFLIGCFL